MLAIPATDDDEVPEDGAVLAGLADVLEGAPDVAEVLEDEELEEQAPAIPRTTMPAATRRRVPFLGSRLNMAAEAT